MLSFTITNCILIAVVLCLFYSPILANRPHVITFRSPNLYPESVSWDPIAQHFIVGSLRYPTLSSITDAGVISTLVSDDSLRNSSFLGVTVDHINSRILVVVFNHLNPSNCSLAAYDLQSPHRRLFLATLYDSASSISASGANDVAVDYLGNSYVTNSASNLIWKVDRDGQPSVLSASKVFTTTPVDPTTPYSSCGLNGIAFNTHGYLLVVQSNTGLLYKVDSEDGTTRKVQLNRALTAPDGVTIRSDGVLLVVSQHKLYFIKSDNSWSDGVVYDETALDARNFPTSVTVGAENRVYVLYGHVKEALMGNSQRNHFGILEVKSAEESGDEAILVYVLIGFGFAYFLFWRFQMRQLVTNLNKKTA